MRTTVTLDDATVAEAAELTGITETSALVRSALETLIRVESARRLTALGGSDPAATTVPRRRPHAARPHVRPRRLGPRDEPVLARAGCRCRGRRPGRAYVLSTVLETIGCLTCRLVFVFVNSPSRRPILLDAGALTRCRHRVRRDVVAGPELAALPVSPGVRQRQEGAQAQGKEVTDLTLAEMTDLWNRAK